MDHKLHAEVDPEDKYDHLTVLVSIMYYTGTMLLGRSLRSTVCSLLSQLPGDQGVKLSPYLLDLVTAFQTCSCSLENGTLRKQYGMVVYAMVLFTTGYWNSLSLPRECAGNPCRNWSRYGSGSSHLGQTLGRMLCQLIGGQGAYQYARTIWSLELCSMHTKRLAAASGLCVTDLTVSVSYGFFLEFISVFADSILVVVLFNSGLSLLKRPAVQKPLLYIMSSGLTCYGLFLTGMYANPANASAQTLGCQGTALWEHVLVYWVAPLAAVSLGRRLETWLAS